MFEFRYYGNEATPPVWEAGELERLPQPVPEVHIPPPDDEDYEERGDGGYYPTSREVFKYKLLEPDERGSEDSQEPQSSEPASQQEETSTQEPPVASGRGGDKPPQDPPDRAAAPGEGEDEGDNGPEDTNDTPPPNPEPHTEPPVDNGEQNRPLIPADYLPNNVYKSAFGPNADPPCTNGLRLVDERFSISKDSEELKTDTLAVTAMQTYLEEFYDEKTTAVLARGREDFRLLREEAVALPPQEVLEYLVEKLEAYTDYLAGGPEPTNWPEATARSQGLVDPLTLVSVVRLAQLTKLSVDIMDNSEKITNGEDLSQRLEDWSSRTASLIAGAGHLRTAIVFINMVDYNRLPDVITDVAEVMAEQKHTDPDKYYTDFSFLATYLQDPAKSLFVKTVPQIKASPVPNIEGEVLKDGVLTQNYASPEPIPAKLANGQTEQLPFTYHRSRNLYDHDTPTEWKTDSAQNEVRYKDLDAAARRAIDVAFAADHTAAFFDPPQYNRIVAANEHSATGGYTQKLCTMAFSEGFVLRSTLPAPSIMSAEIDQRVASIEYVSQGYMAVRDHGTPEFMYYDAEANPFGPGRDANAFWIAGTPRRVIDVPLNDPKFDTIAPMGEEEGERGRWVIMPVVYCRVTTLPLPPRRDDDLL